MSPTQHQLRAIANSYITRYENQIGYAAIIASFALLIAATIATMIASKNINLQMQTTNGQYYAQQAFNAAEAGLEYATNYLQTHQNTLIVDSDGTGFIDSNSTSGTLSGSNASYTFSVSNLQSGNLELIKVSAVGTCENSKTTRTVSRLMSFKPLLHLSSTPQLPITAKNDITLSGNSSIRNTEQTLGTWSGGNVEIKGSANIMTTSANNTKENDNHLHDATTEELFKNYFGTSMASVKDLGVVQVSNGESLDGSSGTVHWVVPQNGTLSIAGTSTVGTTENPVILVVEGDMMMSGSATLSGFVFVTGNFEISGNAQFKGALITNGNFKSSGNADSSYDPSVLSNTAGKLGTYATIPGSWRDE